MHNSSADHISGCAEQIEKVIRSVMYGMGWDGEQSTSGHTNKDGLLRYVSLLLLSAGLVILGFRYEDLWGWMVTLPVYAFMLLLLFGSKIYKSLIR